MAPLIIGQDLWYCPSDRRHGKSKLVNVQKIGRKYIYVGDMKCVPWNHNDYAILNVVEWPYGTIYPNEDVFLKHMNWNEFSRNINHIKLTVDQKQKILEIAGI